MKKDLIKTGSIILGLAVVLAGAPQARAFSLYTSWGMQDGIVSALLSGNSYGAQVGSFVGHIGSPAGPAVAPLYCLDITRPIAFNTPLDYELTNTNHPNLNQPVPNGVTRGNGATAAWIYNTYGQNAPNSDQAGAVQVALWEVLYDGGFDLASGNFLISSYGFGFNYNLSQMIVTAAAGHTGTAGYYRNLGTNGQDLIGSPVPEPASALLVGMGLMSSAFFVRRRRRS